MKLAFFALASVLVGCAVDAGTDSTSSSTTTISQADAAKILDFVNYPTTTEEILDGNVRLDSRAAKAIIAKRNGKDGVYPSADDAPFATLADLDAISYVGETALSKLSSYASMNPAPSGELVEGVAFDGWQSVAVVYGVNHASVTDLDAFLDARAAKALAAGAPYKTVAQMGPMAYVGSIALAALKSHALGWWASSQGQQVDCIGSFESIVSPHLGDLLFMSESDRAIDIVSFPGEGAYVATPQQIITLTKAEAGSTGGIRPTENFYVALEPSSSTADSTAAAKVQTAFGTLTDVVYIYIEKPASDPYHAEVDVYLVGRTSCGDLVGIHSIAVET